MNLKSIRVLPSVFAILIFLYLVANVSIKTPEKPHIEAKHAAMIKGHFDQAVALLRAKQYNDAITALDEILKIQTNIPEVYTNRGFAYLGLTEFKLARSAFERAIDMNVALANAYYGLAIACEGENDLASAIDAMGGYIRLTDPNDKHLTKARESISIWESKLGRANIPAY